MKMKKLLAVVLALTVALTMGFATTATAFAAEQTGSVTVGNTKAGQTYKLYKLFDATTGANDSITYTAPKALGDGSEWFEINSNGYVEAKDGVVDDWAKDPDAIAWAKSYGTQVGDAKVADEDGSTIKWENVPYGYYFVESSQGAFIGVNTVNSDVTINEKNDKPSVDKEITNVTHGTINAATDPEETADVGGGANEHAIAQVGDTISYKLTVDAKPGAENYVVTDTLSKGLTLTESTIAVKVGENALTADTDYTLTVDGQTFTVTFTKAYLDSIEADTNIVITYDSVLNENAVVGSVDGNPNTVVLTWGHDTDTNRSEDSAKVYTAKVGVEKRAESADGELLAGAGFKLKNGENQYYKWDDEANAVTWVAEDEANEFVTETNGKLATEFTGLTNGTYTLVESTVPDGYNKLDDTTVTINSDDYSVENLSQTKVVINNAGSVLPSTGGIGTTIFYILGALLIVGCGVMLIARRRSNNA